MKIRKLDLKDAPYMLEWMHDEDLVKNLQANFQAAKLEDCEAFIRHSWEDTNSLHMAAVNESDEYLGTVSLKNIDRTAKNAEFAIAFRRCALGTGITKFFMEELLRYGLESTGLDMIYWYVSQENIRAVRFYDKCGYPRVSPESLDLPSNFPLSELSHMLFYAVTTAHFNA